MWRLARRLAGNRVGPKGRRYRSFPAAQPPPSDWRDHLAQVGMKGGQSTTQIWKGESEDLARFWGCRADLQLNDP
eukprot:16351251-Heterocapsa_arctica.AAC.1